MSEKSAYLKKKTSTSNGVSNGKIHPPENNSAVLIWPFANAIIIQVGHVKLGSSNKPSWTNIPELSSKYQL